MAKTISEAEMRNIIRAKAAETSQAELARHLGISRAYMNDIIQGKRTISDAIAKRCGYDLRIVYERQYESKSTVEKD